MTSYEISPREREDEERYDAYEFDADLMEREDERHDRVREQTGIPDEE